MKYNYIISSDYISTTIVNSLFSHIFFYYISVMPLTHEKYFYIKQHVNFSWHQQFLGPFRRGTRFSLFLS